MRKLKCFIACAFGKTDIENYYDNYLIPILDILQIKAYRVDKIIHNDKIDQKIINLINQSDFGIADLTYARPSVYYEAGLLEGQNKPVIYTAREDHFKINENDIAGNLRIHFDLITKNIIQWEKIQNDLKARIQLVTKPIIFDLLINESINKKKDEFKILSVSNKLKSIRETCIQYFHSSFDMYSNIHIHNYLHYKIPINKLETNIIIEIVNTLSKTKLQEYIPGDPIYKRRKKDLLIEDKEKVIVIFFALRGIKTSTVESGLFWCDKLADKIFISDLSDTISQFHIYDRIEYQEQVLKYLESITKNSS